MLETDHGNRKRSTGTLPRKRFPGQSEQASLSDCLISRPSLPPPPLHKTRSSEDRIYVGHSPADGAHSVGHLGTANAGYVQLASPSRMRAPASWAIGPPQSSRPTACQSLIDKGVWPHHTVSHRGFVAGTHKLACTSVRHTRGELPLQIRGAYRHNIVMCY
ncbi:hypothetical protein BX600DRAFT_54579 [Xylariales sp. PMI_506]|nr:hypothetical protein BX600DRAFT_54579 [Xylariales sp. PMI_506]